MVGAGDTAMDAVRCSIRLGADEAHIVYRRSEQEKGARAEDYERARDEGVIFDWLTLPKRFIGDENGTVTAANHAALTALGFTSVADLRSRLDAMVDNVRVREASTGRPLSTSDRPFGRALRGELVDVELVLEHGQSREDRVHRVIAAPVSANMAGTALVFSGSSFESGLVKCSTPPTLALGS